MSDEPTQQLRTDETDDGSPATQQLDTMAEASHARPETKGASADGSLRNFMVGLLAVSLVVVVLAFVAEAAAG